MYGNLFIVIAEISVLFLFRFRPPVSRPVCRRYGVGLR